MHRGVDITFRQWVAYLVERRDTALKFHCQRLMVKTRLIRQSSLRLLVMSETYVTDLARISGLKQADEIRPDRDAFLPS